MINLQKLRGKGYKFKNRLENLAFYSYLDENKDDLSPLSSLEYKELKLESKETFAARVKYLISLFQQ